MRCPRKPGRQVLEPRPRTSSPSSREFVSNLLAPFERSALEAVRLSLSRQQRFPLAQAKSAMNFGHPHAPITCTPCASHGFPHPQSKCWGLLAGADDGDDVDPAFPDIEGNRVEQICPWCDPLAAPCDTSLYTGVRTTGKDMTRSQLQPACAMLPEHQALLKAVSYMGSISTAASS